MANSCYFSMRITGSKAACEEFSEVLSFRRERRFYGLYESECTFKGVMGNNYIMEFNGECAWSVDSSLMKEQGASYTTLEFESRKLNLMIEVYSTESSNEFAEHALYESGVRIKYECVDYSELYWDESDYPNIEDLNAHYGTTYLEEDFDMNGYHIEGGFGEWEFLTKGVKR